MPYVDQHGNEMKQIQAWIPMDLYHLVKADRLNVSRFVREQLEILYGDESLEDSLTMKFRFVRGARETCDRQREIAAEASANRERLKEVVRQMRDDRIAVTTATAAKASGIRDALLQIVGDGPTDRYRRMLPENDPNGDRVDDWEALVRRVSRLCGAGIDTADVAAGLRELIAAKA